jgi:hypothetical protein
VSGPLRALTLHRPWPWSILHGGKRIENRPWAPWKSIVGERIALHAGKTWDYDGAEFIKRTVRMLGGPEMPGDGGVHLQGAIVGVARVVGCIRENGNDDPVIVSGVGGLHVDVDEEWFFGPFGWILTDVVALAKPVSCRGAQGLWLPPPDVTARVLEQIAGAP